ncbi:PREDICTED: death-associated protein 1 isoform X1 [Pseudopodoces humilis]|uniref:death-associated protein 1 isoform X1 n=1 Tax=Pseudopodoces humilis TaxID=181119 RepID=UPI0006B76CCE|nr:PREDICTED: death-associated protein 1 isoform X1 [Pseudopodoces humilis]
MLTTDYKALMKNACMSTPTHSIKMCFQLDSIFHLSSISLPREEYKVPQLASMSRPPKPAVFISGVIARGDKDFPPAAAQVAHQKPHPSVEKLPHPQHVKQHIHQPRK